MDKSRFISRDISNRKILIIKKLKIHLVEKTIYEIIEYMLNNLCFLIKKHIYNCLCNCLSRDMHYTDEQHWVKKTPLY